MLQDATDFNRQPFDSSLVKHPLPPCMLKKTANEASDPQKDGLPTERSPQMPIVLPSFST